MTLWNLQATGWNNYKNKTKQKISRVRCPKPWKTKMACIWSYVDIRCKVNDKQATIHRNSKGSIEEQTKNKLVLFGKWNKTDSYENDYGVDLGDIIFLIKRAINFKLNLLKVKHTYLLKGIKMS